MVNVVCMHGPTREGDTTMHVDPECSKVDQVLGSPCLLLCVALLCFAWLCLALKAVCFQNKVQGIGGCDTLMFLGFCCCFFYIIVANY